MIDWIETLEDKLVRVETWALVGCVVGMLVLAGYNVLYRNALIPLQTHLRTSGPAAEASEEGGRSADTDEDPSEIADDGAEDDETDGFGGGVGRGAEQGGSESDESGSNDEAGGFDGGFGGGSEDDEPAEEEPGTEDEADGFGGGFGGGASDGDDDSAEDESDGFGGGFGDEGGVETGGEPDRGAPVANGESRVTSHESRVRGGPPPEGSLAARVVETIDAIKLPWIDIFLRQLVLVVGFLGAMLAARRREHITIDAVGQIVTGRTRDAVDTGTSIFAALICAVLASSGWDLVDLGMQFPRELLPGAKQWQFQMMFPIGFGLTGLHFALRAVDSGRRAFAGEGDGASAEPPASGDTAGQTGGGA